MIHQSRPADNHNGKNGLSDKSNESHSHELPPLDKKKLNHDQRKRMNRALQGRSVMRACVCSFGSTAASAH